MFRLTAAESFTPRLPPLVSCFSFFFPLPSLCAHLPLVLLFLPLPLPRTLITLWRDPAQLASVHFDDCLLAFLLFRRFQAFMSKGDKEFPLLPVSSLRKTNAISRSIANTPRRFSKHFGIIFLSTMIYAFRLPDRYIMVSYVRRRGELRPADAFDAFVYSRVTFMSESIPF